MCSGRKCLPWLLLLPLAALAGACGDDSASVDAAGVDGSPPPDLATDLAVEVDDDAGAPDASHACPNLQGPSVDHKVVINYPFVNEGTDYEVLLLSAGGTLSATGTHFAMPKAATGEIVFTPNGKIGLVAQDQGTVGVFRFNAAGTPEVVHSAFHVTDGQGEGVGHEAYAMAIVVDDAGDRAWVIDSQTAENGGGIYAVHIGVDGTLSNDGLVVGGDIPGIAYFRWQVPGQVLLGARSMVGAAAGDTIHLLQWGSPPTYLAGAQAFPLPVEYVSYSSIGVTGNERYALLPDACELCGTNRVSVVELVGASLVFRQMLMLPNGANPAWVVASPYCHEAALAISADPAGVYPIHPTATPGQFQVGSKFPRSGESLPSVGAVIRKGPLVGRALVSDFMKVRQFQFHDDEQGSIVELDSLNLAHSIDAIGVQP